LLFRKLVLHRMCLCITAQDRAVMLSENLITIKLEHPSASILMLTSIADLLSAKKQPD